MSFFSSKNITRARFWGPIPPVWTRVTVLARDDVGVRNDQVWRGDPSRALDAVAARHPGNPDRPGGRLDHFRVPDDALFRIPHVCFWGPDLGQRVEFRDGLRKKPGRACARSKPAIFESFSRWGARPRASGPGARTGPITHTSVRESTSPSAAPPRPSSFVEAELRNRDLIELPMARARTSPSTAKARILASVTPRAKDQALVLRNQ